MAVPLASLHPKWLENASGMLFGIEFDCPCALCARAQEPGRLQLVFVNAPDPVRGSHSRYAWLMSGTGFDDLTVQPSIPAGHGTWTLVNGEVAEVVG